MIFPPLIAVATRCTVSLWHGLRVSQRAVHCINSGFDRRLRGNTKIGLIKFYSAHRHGLLAFAFKGMRNNSEIRCACACGKLNNKIKLLQGSLHLETILYYNILTTGYRNFGQSDWFPTQGIWGNVPLLPYLGSPLITINVPFSSVFSFRYSFPQSFLIAISCGEYIIKQLLHSISSYINS